MLDLGKYKSTWFRAAFLLTASALTFTSPALSEPQWEKVSDSKIDSSTGVLTEDNSQMPNAISSSTNIRCTESWSPDIRDPRNNNSRFCYLHVVECVDTRTGIKVSIDYKKECFDKPVHGKIECGPVSYPGNPDDSCVEKAANNSMACAQSADCLHKQGLWSCYEQSGSARRDCFNAVDAALLDAMRTCASNFENDMAECKPENDDPLEHCLRTAGRACELLQVGCDSMPKQTREQCYKDADRECDRMKEACDSKTVAN
jgi:hypothetical protein